MAPPPSRPKKIGAAALLGERGVNLLAGKVMEMGYVWYPTGGVEAGIDGYVEIRDTVTGAVMGQFLIRSPEVL